MVIGLIDGRHWSAITTTRGDRTRIISVRGSRKNEEAAYDGAADQGG
nr:BrnT family toxin [Bifidobacterium aesculapii]